MTSLLRAYVPSKINTDIEALRGFAALFVVWHHVQVYPYLLDPGFTPRGIFSYAPSGHFAVLIFFILSGYVIGLSTPRISGWASSWTYLKKRLVRLYPIYLVTLLLAFLVTTRPLALSTALGNVALLQGLLVSCDANPPGWSLHYEMLYYLLFIPVSFLRLNPFLLAAGVLALALGNYFLYPALNIPILTAYGYGFVFWLLGFGLNQRLTTTEAHKPARRILLGGVLLLLCIDQYNVFDTLLRKLLYAIGLSLDFPTATYWAKTAVQFRDLAYLPIALLLLLLFTGKFPRFTLLLLRILVGFSASILVYVAKHWYSGDLNMNAFAIPTVFFLAALVCLFGSSTVLEKVGHQAVQVGSKLGQLSYGIYLVHFPLLVVFSRVPFLSGTWQTFLLRSALLLLLVLVFAYLLEQVLQPRIKALFRDRPASLLPPVPSISSVTPPVALFPKHIGDPLL